MGNTGPASATRAAEITFHSGCTSATRPGSPSCHERGAEGGEAAATTRIGMGG